MCESRMSTSCQPENAVFRMVRMQSPEKAVVIRVEEMDGVQVFAGSVHPLMRVVERRRSMVEKDKKTKRREYDRAGQERRQTRREVRDRKTEEQDLEKAEESFLSGRLEGRNAVIEAFRSGRTVERVYVQEGLTDGPISTILREAAKAGTEISRVSREQLDAMSETGRHQGVIARAAAFSYGSIEDMLALAKERGEDPFLVLLDGIEYPHNLGAIIRTACFAGAHGVIIPKHRAVGLTPAAVRASAGAVHHVPVAKVANIGKTIEELREAGLWFVCADMDGEPMYKLSLTGPIGVVVGSEGDGVGRLVREKCDFTAAIPRRGPLDSLNASVAAGVMLYEIVRQRINS